MLFYEWVLKMYALIWLPDPDYKGITAKCANGVISGITFANINICNENENKCVNYQIMT